MLASLSESLLAFWLVFVSRTPSQLLLGKRLALVTASLSVLPAHRWPWPSACWSPLEACRWP